MALGRGMFQVDESFVKSNLKGLTDDDRALMDAFVGQSLHGGESADGGECAVPVKKALYKVAQRGEFNLDGRMIATDGGRSTKLTKLFKRRDNEGKLLHELHRMKLD